MFEPKNIIEVIIPARMIIPYSVIKIKANPTPLYSTLNPDTNSDSPSPKSNGVRFSSASIIMYHIKNRGVKKMYHI